MPLVTVPNLTKNRRPAVLHGIELGPCRTGAPDLYVLGPRPVDQVDGVVGPSLVRASGASGLTIGIMCSIMMSWNAPLFRYQRH